MDALFTVRHFANKVFCRLHIINQTLIQSDVCRWMFALDSSSAAIWRKRALNFKS